MLEPLTLGSGDRQECCPGAGVFLFPPGHWISPAVLQFKTCLAPLQQAARRAAWAPADTRIHLVTRVRMAGGGIYSAGQAQVNCAARQEIVAR